MLRELGATTSEVRVTKDLEGLDGIIFPGGESTAMAIVGGGGADSIFSALQRWVADDKPVWGTCAGMILLADGAVGQKLGGQALVGGLHVQVCRNFFGAQVASFEVPLPLPIATKPDADSGDTKAATKSTAEAPYPAVFIRAPAIMKASDDVEVLATVSAAPSRAAQEVISAAETSSGKARKRARAEDESEGAGTAEREVIVAAKQGRILATAFHPELTDDTRWHRYFLDIVEEAATTRAA